jgi:hypothetical protein
MQYTTFTSGNTVISAQRAVVHGFAIRATATAVIHIHDNATGSGTAVIKIAAPTTDTVLYDSSKGIPFNNGIYVEVVSGTATGSIFWE